MTKIAGPRGHQHNIGKIAKVEEEYAGAGYAMIRKTAQWITRKSARQALALLLAAIGVFLLVGCIYLPIPEHRVNSKQRDFRPLVGNQLRPGVSRQAVLRLLGDAPYRSVDGRTVVYFLDTEEGFWIGLTCFGSAEQRAHALILRYDDNDVLKTLDQDFEAPARAAFDFSLEPFNWLHGSLLKYKVPEVPVNKNDLPPYLIDFDRGPSSR